MTNRLRVLRADRSWSQADLAARLRFSRETVDAIETGRYHPSLPLAFHIARVFACRIDDVFQPDGEGPNETALDHKPAQHGSPLQFA